MRSQFALSPAEAQGQLVLAASTLARLHRQGQPIKSQVYAVIRAVYDLDLAIAAARPPRPCRTRL